MEIRHVAECSNKERAKETTKRAIVLLIGQGTIPLGDRVQLLRGRSVRLRRAAFGSYLRSCLWERTAVSSAAVSVTGFPQV